MGDKQIYYQTAQEQLKQQLTVVDTLDGKINPLLAVSGGFVFFFGELVSRNVFFIGCGFPFFAISMILLLVAYRTKNFQQGPNIDFVKYSLEKDSDINKFYEETIKTLTDCYTENESKIDRKANLIDWALDLLVIGIIATLLNFAYYLWYSFL